MIGKLLVLNKRREGQGQVKLRIHNFIEIVKVNWN